MAKLTTEQRQNIFDKMSDDKSRLGKLYKAFKCEYEEMSIPHGMVDAQIKEGWEIKEIKKSVTKIRRKKTISKMFEHQVWCQFYELGFRCLNIDDQFHLKWGDGEHDEKQLDVVAVGEEAIFVVECKAAEEYKPAPSFKDEVEALRLRKQGVISSLRQVYGDNKKVKFVFATKNYSFAGNSADLDRFREQKVFIYDEKTQKYIDKLIKSYKDSAMYQFYGLLFRDEEISNKRIEIPAIEGTMGKHKYYMFSIEPAKLLKMGFVLHRTAANDFDLPTYQRLLIPKRLKGITQYIEGGGYFPNSIIVNFNEHKHKLQFEADAKKPDSKSRFGTLKIPNVYGIAYIIDGQHRVYGYAGSDYKNTNTIPVVAFVGMKPEEQLEIFMDINQNQKAVSKDLRLDLEEDMLWGSDKIDSKMKALRSSIIKVLANKRESPLYNMITVGEDTANLSFTSFDNAFSKSSLIPKATASKFKEDSLNYAIYDVTERDYDKAMRDSRDRIADFVIRCYLYIKDNYPSIFDKECKYIMSNRGVVPYVCLISDLRSFLIDKGDLNKSSSVVESTDAITKYLKALMEGLMKLSDDEKEKMLSIQGARAETVWLRTYQDLINKEFSSYNPPKLIEWRETQDKQLQEKGRELGQSVITEIRGKVILQLKDLFGKHWDLEINSIKNSCTKRANDLMAKYHKEGVDFEEIDWTDMLEMSEIKAIIERYWSKEKTDEPTFQTFEKLFSFDIGEGFGTKAEKTKWLSVLSSYKDLWSSDNKGLNRSQVEKLETIYKFVFRVN